MKVPIRYKSSDRYNAGVDVVYDDESKLEYAPFVYATTASGDNGGSEDEEGEESMLITVTDGTLNKNYSEIKSAVESGKVLYFVEDGVIYFVTHYYFEDTEYTVEFTCVISSTLYTYSFVADNETDSLVNIEQPIQPVEPT